MPRIRLAYWHGRYAPGEEIDVTDDELRALSRDGRVAEVVTSHLAGAEPQEEQHAESAPVPEPGAEGPKAPAPEGRKRR